MSSSRHRHTALVRLTAFLFCFTVPPVLHNTRSVTTNRHRTQNGASEAQHIRNAARIGTVPHVFVQLRTTGVRRTRQLVNLGAMAAEGGWGPYVASS